MMESYVSNANLHLSWQLIQIAKKSAMHNFVIGAHIIAPKFVRNASPTTIIQELRVFAVLIVWSVDASPAKATLFAKFANLDI